MCFGGIVYALYWSAKNVIMLKYRLSLTYTAWYVDIYPPIWYQFKIDCALMWTIRNFWIEVWPPFFRSCVRGRTHASGSSIFYKKFYLTDLGFISVILNNFRVFRVFCFFVDKNTENHVVSYNQHLFYIFVYFTGSGLKTDVYRNIVFLQQIIRLLSVLKMWVSEIADCAIAYLQFARRATIS
jgi:hypothetical protein